MSSPKPLTATDAPKIDWSRPGTPAAEGFDDIYFSTDGGLAETEAVFLKACGLPDGWMRKERYVIGELGFGTGLNFLAAWRLWKQSGATGRLHFISVERYPLDQEQLSKALSAWAELSEFSNQLITAWPGRVKGYHRLEFGDVVLTLIHDDILEALNGLSASVNAWFLDGFSPAKNPDMWSPEVMKELARLSAPKAVVGTFTVAGAVRNALSEAGFTVSKLPGFGRKRHRLAAVYEGGEVVSQAEIKPIIIGGGIAGASLARSFLSRGIVPTIIDPDDGTAASGNPAAIIKPRLDLQDRPESRFFLSSFLYAHQLYQKSVLREGVYQAAKTDKDKARFEKLAMQAALPDMSYGAGAHDTEGLHFDKALVIDPVIAKTEFTKGANRIMDRAVKVESGACLDKDGKKFAEGTHIFWACGFGIRQTPISEALGLRYSRGQLTWVKPCIDEVLTYGGYALPLDRGTLLGATHERLDDRDPHKVRVEDDLKNIEQFESLTGVNCSKKNMPSRSSVRVTTASTQPVMAQINPGEWAITGLGSRGFVFAPLLAESLVSKLTGEPMPISAAQWTAFTRHIELAD